MGILGAKESPGRLETRSKRSRSKSYVYPIAREYYQARLAGPAASASWLSSRLKVFREMVAARVPYYGQQVLPHSNLLDPHFRSQFADFLGIAQRKAQVARSQRAARFSHVYSYHSY